MTRQERRNQLAQQRGYSSYYAERVAKGSARGLTARQAVGKAPRATTAPATAPSPAAGSVAPLTRTQTAAGTVYEVPSYNVGRLSTIIANLSPSQRIQFVLTGADGKDHPLYSKGGRYAGIVRGEVAAAGGFDAWLQEEADNIAAGGGSDWRDTAAGGIDIVTMTVLAR